MVSLKKKNLKKNNLKIIDYLQKKKLKKNYLKDYQNKKIKEQIEL